MENPTWRLAPIVARLFELGDDQSLPALAREAARERALELRGHLVTLLERRRGEAAQEYSEALDSMAVVRAMMESADSSPAMIPDVLERARELGATLARLLRN